jgi:alpha-N-acetylglucosamine transferase
MSEGIYPVIVFILLAAVAIVTSILTSFCVRMVILIYRKYFAQND